jgi:hypothetical protein
MSEIYNRLEVSGSEEHVDAAAREMGSAAWLVAAGAEHELLSGSIPAEREPERLRVSLFSSEPLTVYLARVATKHRVTVSHRFECHRDEIHELISPDNLVLVSIESPGDRSGPYFYAQPYWWRPGAHLRVVDTVPGRRRT